MTTLQTAVTTATTVTASGALVAGKHTPVDATSGPKVMTLPTPATIGARLRVEKVDASTNTVTVSGTIRGSAGTFVLDWQYETVEVVAETLTSWRPASDHKPKAGMNSVFRPMAPQVRNSYQPAQLTDPAGTQQFFVRGVDGTSTVFVRDRTSQGLPENWLRLSYDNGATFPDWMYYPAGVTDNVDGPVVWAGGYIFGCFRDTASTTYGVYRAPWNPTGPNLLREAQSTFETTTVVRPSASTNCASLTISTAWAAEGTKSLAASSTAAGDMKWIGDGSQNSGLVPISASTQYTATLTSRAATAARQVRCELRWFTSAKVFISAVAGTYAANSTTADTVFTATGTAPSNAAYATIATTVQATGAAAEVHYFDKLGVMQGATAPWSAPRFGWTKVQTLAAGTNSMTSATIIDTDGTYIWVGDPGDPVGGPSIYRSADLGATWQTVWSDARFRHVHAVKHDPYNPGHVWASLGDGDLNPFKYLKSTDNGATFTSLTFTQGLVPQGAQLSFSQNWVWAGVDSAKNDPPIVMRRDGSAWFYASTQGSASFAVPGAVAGNSFNGNAIYGIVDPATEVFYLVSDASTSAFNCGLFILPRVGERLVLISTDVFTQASQGPMYAQGGKLFFGNHTRSLWATPVPTPAV